MATSMDKVEKKRLRRNKPSYILPDDFNVERTVEMAVLG